MCHDRSWFIAQEKKADDRKEKGRRNETVDALLRESNEQALKSRAEPVPAKEAAPAK